MLAPPLWNTTLIQQVTTHGVADKVAEFLSNFDKLDPLRQPRRLRLQFCKGSDYLLATISANNKLHLEFFPEKKQEVHQIRNFILKLQFNHRRVQSFVTHQPCLSTFFVKTMYLKSVTSLANEVTSSSNFKFLENLKIIECDGLQSLEIESSPKLLSLTIFDCSRLKSLHLRTSKLKYFRYRGFLPQIQPEHHFDLVEAMLDFKQGPGNSGFKTSDFDPMLLTIKNAQVLTLCKWTFQTLIWPSLLPLQASFTFYRLKELWWIDNLEETCNSSDALISFLKLCPALMQLFVTSDSDHYYMESTAQRTKSHTQLANLEVIKLQSSHESLKYSVE